MKLFVSAVMLCGLFSVGAFAVDAGHASLGQIQDKILSQVEGEVVSLAEAMPPDKYDFAPTQGAFAGVRTFGQQMTHIATALNSFSAGILGEKPMESGDHENGPDSLHGKDAVVKYLKDAFVYAHKAALSLTEANFSQEVTLPWGKSIRADLAEESIWHTFDHYGQAVVYARMNNVVPPASRKQ